MGKRGNVAIGTIIAAGIGYAAGLLTAPKSGRETRKDIRKKALQAKTEAEQKLKQAHSELSKVLDEINAKAKTGKDKVAKEVQVAIDKAEAARQKARELLSAIHEGEAEDQDLKQAVDDTKQALDHLKKYIGKKAATK
jgi:gas vesicle protein